MAPLVKVEGLTKSFGDNQILHGIDLEVAAGEVISIIGPSGSGKTTILRCLNLLERPDGGRIEIDGQMLCEDGANGRIKFAGKSEIRKVREEVGMVFQRFNLFPHMTALENVIEAPMAVKGADKAVAKSRALELLDSVGLSHRADHYPLQMSGGQQQQLAIARALVSDPSLLLLDEPAAGMNPAETHEMTELIGRLSEEAGYSILVIEHDMHVVEGISDRVIAIDHGVKIAEGSFEEVAEDRTVIEAYLGSGSVTT